MLLIPKIYQKDMAWDFLRFKKFALSSETGAFDKMNTDDSYLFLVKLNFLLPFLVQ